MSVDDRKGRILSAIVSLYASGGEPIGSGHLCEYMGISVSSATLRSEMAALTKLGFLEQPHTSAGRVPSCNGYRYYIDNLMPTAKIVSSSYRDEIDLIFKGLDYEPERLVKGVAKAVSRLTGYTAIATTPQSEDVKIAYFNVVQSGQFTAAVLSVNSVGGVATRVAVSDKPLSSSDILKVTSFLNENLCFISRDDITPYTENLLRKNLGDDFIWSIVLAGITLLKGAGRSKVFIAGQEKLVNWIDDAGSIKSCLRLLGKTDELKQVITPHISRTTVVIGEEISQNPLIGAAVVAKGYSAGGGRAGTIALIGPARMPYLEIIPKIEYFAAKLGSTITFESH